MQIVFDNLDELTGFMEWAGFKKKSKLALEQLIAESDYTDGIDAQTTATTEPVAAIDVAPESNADAPKRKRRTKAEIEAEKQTEAKPSDWLFTPPAAANESAPVLGLTNPSDTQPVTQAAATPADTNEDSASWIARRAGELGTVDVAVHLTQCRAFIAAHGMAAYSAAGQSVGLTDVLSFNDAQRATHSAALEYWNERQPK